MSFFSFSKRKKKDSHKIDPKRIEEIEKAEAEREASGEEHIHGTPHPIFSRPRLVSAPVSQEAAAAYDAAHEADLAAGGEWNHEILALYTAAADLRHPLSADLVGNHLSIADPEKALHYLKLAIELGRDVFYSIGALYDIHFNEPQTADEWYRRGAREVCCNACADELKKPSFRK